MTNRISHVLLLVLILCLSFLVQVHFNAVTIPSTIPFLYVATASMFFSPSLIPGVITSTQGHSIACEQTLTQTQREGEAKSASSL